MSLSENIKSLRTSFGLSQVEFAGKLHVTKQCVSNWENDNVLPSIEMLVKIADFFSVSTDYLLGRDDKNVILAHGLEDGQLAHVSQIVNDFRELNKKCNSLTEKNKSE